MPSKDVAALMHNMDVVQMVYQQPLDRVIWAVLRHVPHQHMAAVPMVKQLLRDTIEKVR